MDDELVGVHWGKLTPLECCEEVDVAVASWVQGVQHVRECAPATMLELMRHLIQRRFAKPFTRKARYLIFSESLSELRGWLSEAFRGEAAAHQRSWTYRIERRLLASVYCKQLAWAGVCLRFGWAKDIEGPLQALSAIVADIGDAEKPVYRPAAFPERESVREHYLRARRQDRQVVEGCHVLGAIAEDLRPDHPDGVGPRLLVVRRLDNALAEYQSAAHAMDAFLLADSPLKNEQPGVKGAQGGAG
jgi:hypothetical protein